MLSQHLVSASATIPVAQPATPAFSTSWESGLGAAFVTSGTLSISNDVARTGPSSAKVARTTVSSSTLWIPVSGLTIGTTYTLSAYAYSTVRGTQASVYVGSTGPGYTSLTLGKWVQSTFTWVATATSSNLQLQALMPNGVAGDAIYWDDIALTSVAGDVLTYVNLPVEGGSITLDEGWAPYAQATLEIPIPELSILAALDPRRSVRVSVSLASVYGDMYGDWNPEGGMTPTTRVFNLRLTGRRTNHKDGTMTLSLASDESALQSYALVTTEPRLLSTTSAVTAVRDAMSLAVPGATLNIVADLASKPTITRTNMFTNPTPAVAATGWVGGNATVTRTTVAGLSGFSLRVSAATAGNVDSFMSQGDAAGVRNGMIAGRTYTASGLIRVIASAGPLSANRSHKIVAFTKKTGDTGYSETQGVEAPNVTGNYRVSVTFTVPAGVSEAFVRFYNGSGTTTDYVYWTQLLLEETDEVRPYFDGATTNTVEQTTAWTGAVNTSTSTAVVRAHVSAEATTWKPGVSAWDYLSSLLTATSMRLFCDEQRVWRLVDSAYNIPGSVRISNGENLVDASDTIARDNDGTWFDAVVVKYTWSDSDGNTRVKYDTASLPNYQQTRLVEIDAAYPGPGAAAYILKRSYGRGRVLALRGISDYSAQPGMEATATLPLSPVQSGYISAVTWNLDSDEMDIETRGLIDTPLTAWNQQPTGKAWSSIPTGTTWANFTA